MVNYFLGIVSLLIISSSSKAQSEVPDTVLIVYWHNAITSKCVLEASSKYQVGINLATTSCLFEEWYNSDSVDLHNKKVEEWYSLRLGENWLEKMKGEIRNCQDSTCNLDSIKLYTDFGKGGGNGTVFMMTPGSADFHPSQLCLIDNSIAYLMLKYKTIKIEIGSHALANETEYSIKRAERLKEHLVSQGIDADRIKIQDYRDEDPRLIAHPDHLMNCRLVCNILEY